MPRTTTARRLCTAAAYEGHKDVAELLLANKADVNARDNTAMTPLHMAAIWGHKDVAELLLANKADVNAKDNNGGTPLGNARPTISKMRGICCASTVASRIKSFFLFKRISDRTFPHHASTSGLSS